MTYKLTSLRNDYLTPHYFVERVLNIAGLNKFDCDVCCSHFNVPAHFYYKQDGLYFRYKNNLTERLLFLSGLQGKWFKNNWCNPPFNITSKFVYKAIEEQKRGCTTYMLLPARTETEYWRNGIMTNGKPNKKDIDITFLKKELSFLLPDTQSPVQMKVKQKNGSTKLVNGLCKEPLALVIFKGKTQ